MYAIIVQLAFVPSMSGVVTVTSRVDIKLCKKHTVIDYDYIKRMYVFLNSYRRKMTTKELATELEVSERTILRDMDALSHAGIPITSNRGKDGGWRLLDNFRTHLSGLNIGDVKSLFLFPSEELLKDLGFNKQTLDTRQKLLASIPDTFQEEAQVSWERIHIDSGTWRQTKESVHALKTVQQAVWESKRLTIVYIQANGEQKERLVEPLGLVAIGNRWYLVASRNENCVIKGYHAYTQQRLKMKLSVGRLISIWGLLGAIQSRAYTKFAQILCTSRNTSVH
ncbi:YafY family protein [Paenibacillus sp. J2TS4]|uniref:helix-turn-helix transcriptional regulator n=1 Tax=Paenibacillus sp. J2TS4 TaxID=2807194 RepID=UPI001B027722|nr:HTH domain-containing protein [Paenibacillus sp. J2TS4]GIP34592.1 hypothetical protein J2TS4_38020 [Paenibacillus sp. J2TS4]